MDSHLPGLLGAHPHLQPGGLAVRAGKVDRNNDLGNRLSLTAAIWKFRVVPYAIFLNAPAVAR